MERRRTRLLIVGLIVLALLCAGGYLLLGGGRNYSSDMGGLRDQFNRDRGKVRLVMVLSPT